MDDWSFAVYLFMNVELGVLFFDEKTTILRCTYEGIGILWTIGK